MLRIEILTENEFLVISSSVEQTLLSVMKKDCFKNSFSRKILGKGENHA